MAHLRPWKKRKKCLASRIFSQVFFALCLVTLAMAIAIEVAIIGLKCVVKRVFVPYANQGFNGVIRVKKF